MMIFLTLRIAAVARAMTREVSGASGCTYATPAACAAVVVSRSRRVWRIILNLEFQYLLASRKTVILTRLLSTGGYVIHLNGLGNESNFVIKREVLKKLSLMK